MSLSDFIQSKLILPEDLEKKALEIKEGGATVATLNSDASIQQYKSPLRHIIPLAFRLQMMASIAFVDYVTYYEETTPMNFIEKVKPHVHVNGADYGANCIEAQAVK